MAISKDPFESVGVEDVADVFEDLNRKPCAVMQPEALVTHAATARFHGFDLDDRPLVSGINSLPGEIVCAQATVAISRSDIGSTVVLLFDGGDVRRPIVVGVIQKRDTGQSRPVAPLIPVEIDEARIVLSAEREIVLRCGDASITLTRAGKVIIRGNYIVSRSSGYNKIKGAAVDIN